MKAVAAADDDETEIVVVSDTVRQRRARTPSSSTTPVKESSIERDSNGVETAAVAGDEQQASPAKRQNVLPDLLPRTFHLAESSSLFSQFNERDDFESKPVAQDSNEQPFSVVAIRETNLSELRKPTYTGDRMAPMHLLTPKVGEINTVTILEKVEYFEPEFVETVNIIDATSEASDTDTCTTPVPPDEPRTPRISDSFDPPVNEVKTTELANRDNHSPRVLRVERKKIIHSNDRSSSKSSDDRDLLLDSEVDDRRSTAAHPTKTSHSTKKCVVLGLNTALSSLERDSFYNSDNENFDEPLIFSEDDDVPMTLTLGNISTDYDSDDSAPDTVFILYSNQIKQS